MVSARSRRCSGDTWTATDLPRTWSSRAGSSRTPRRRKHCKLHCARSWRKSTSRARAPGSSPVRSTATAAHVRTCCRSSIVTSWAAIRASSSFQASPPSAWGGATRRRCSTCCSSMAWSRDCGNASAAASVWRCASTRSANSAPPSGTRSWHRRSGWLRFSLARPTYHLATWRRGGTSKASNVPPATPLTLLPAVLRVPTYQRYAASRAASGTASTMLQAVVAWQVYALTGSALDLGLIGLVRFAPNLALSLVSGAVVDAYDRRAVLTAAQAITLLGTLLMLTGLATHNVSIGSVYAFVFALGVAAAFENPARQVLLPATVPRSLFSRAIVVNSTLQSFASVTGPALGGVLIAWQGI